MVRFIMDEDGKPRNATVGKVFNIICCLGTNMLLDYVIIPFRAMSLERSMTAWGSLHYVGHIGTAISLVIDIILRLTAPRKEKKAKE